MIELALANGGVTLLDDEDRALTRFRWYRRPNGYAMRFEGPRGAQRCIRLAREVLGLGRSGREPDHINRDKLDNRRSNLRAVEHAENMQNQGARVDGQHRGVCFDRRRGRWLAQSKLNYRRYWLGYHATEIAAARAAEAFRRAHMPFAVPDLSLGVVPPCPCLMCRAAVA